VVLQAVLLQVVAVVRQAVVPLTAIVVYVILQRAKWQALG